MLLIGIFDDKFSLSVKFRIVIELACAFLVAQSDMRIHNMHGILGIYELPVVLQYSISMFLILAITNAFNLMDGIDGLVGGIAVVNLALMMTAFLMLGEVNWLLIFIPLIISLLFFLKYNWSPAKIFMGDTGSLALGGLLGYIAIVIRQEILLAIVGAARLLRAGRRARESTKNGAIRVVLQNRAYSFESRQFSAGTRPCWARGSCRWSFAVSP